MGKSRQALQHYWEQQLQQWKSSGTSGARYCQQHNLTYSQFGYWKKKLSEAATDQTEPVRASRSGFVRVVQHPQRRRAPSELTITLPNGVVLSGINPSQLDIIVQLLERV